LLLPDEGMLLEWVTFCNRMIVRCIKRCPVHRVALRFRFPPFARVLRRYLIPVLVERRRNRTTNDIPQKLTLIYGKLRRNGLSKQHQNTNRETCPSHTNFRFSTKLPTTRFDLPITDYRLPKKAGRPV